MPGTLYRSLTAAAWFAAQPWVMWKRARGGSEWKERLGGLPAGRPGTIWVHAASVGEIAAAAPLVRALSERGLPVLLTVMTTTGNSVARRLVGPKVTVAFPPLDLVPPVRIALSAVAPRALLIVETELWPNLIVEAAWRGTIVGVVNGRLSERSLRRYRLPGFPLLDLREAISFVACRSQEDMRRFRSLGLPDARLTVAGDMKFEALAGPLPESDRAALRDVLSAGNSRVVVFGSVRPLEERAVADAASAALRDPGVRVVVAPRHTDRVPGIAERLSSSGLSVCTWSGLSSGREDAAQVTIVDTTGELAGIYSIADVAFVGGTLAPYGGHNPLEPAAQGVPIVFGPHTESCDDAARLLVSTGAAAVVEDGPGLRDVVIALLADEVRRANMGRSALEAVASRRGAVGNTMRLLESCGVIGEPASAERP
jgi:3-deoxy-D-manno-octulosonic-acid transferase